MDPFTCHITSTQPRSQHMKGTTLYMSKCPDVAAKGTPEVGTGGRKLAPMVTGGRGAGWDWSLQHSPAPLNILPAQTLPSCPPPEPFILLYLTPYFLHTPLLSACSPYLIPKVPVLFNHFYLLSTSLPSGNIWNSCPCFFLPTIIQNSWSY